MGQEVHFKDTNNVQSNSKEYSNKHLSDLLKETNEKLIAGFLALPSFSSQYALSIKEDSLGVYKIIIENSDEYYWCHNGKKIQKFKNKEKIIDAEIALSIKELLKKAIPAINILNENSVDADINIYYFSTTNQNGELVTSKKSSPRQGVKISNLIELFNNLISYTLDYPITKNDILNQIHLLKKEFS